MKMLVYLVFISSFLSAQERRALRALYKDEQPHQWQAAPTAAVVCGICLDPGQLKSLSCHREHRFHISCIEEWRKIRNTCPICRTEIIDSVLCNCLKSLSKPGICVPGCLGLSYALIKAGERIGEYVQLLGLNSADLGQHCAGCCSVGVYCCACLAVGPVLYCLKNYKHD